MLDNLKSKKFWECAFARSLRTLLQTFVALVSTSTLINEVNWKIAISTSLLSALVSIATSIIAGIPESENKK